MKKGLLLVIIIAFFSCKTEKSNPDNVHYNAEGQKRLGKAFGEKLIALNK